jgi:RsiW-degrading membrane proteinase PrsW (M82 family)
MTSQTKSVLLLVFLGLLAGIAVGMGFIAIASALYALHYGAC